MAQVPIAEGLFTWPAEDPRLLGSRCEACGSYAFPVQATCPNCASDNVGSTELAPTGTVWTWTSQEFLPPVPPYRGPESRENFRPYFVGYVELDGQLRVESRLTGFEGAPPRIGEQVRLEVVGFRVDDDGNEVMMYTFARAEDGSHG